ncbi:MAG: hypothetical protein ACTSWQ_09715 [Candidatus Thorarchaeota archaeon]
MKKQIQINDLIFEKVKFRYDFHDRSRVRIRGKVLLDTLYPFELARAIKTNVNIKKIPPSYDGYAISERVSEDLGAKKLHISELVAMLGYTKTDISKILQAVKNKELNCVLVGLGGTGSNFLHWLYEMSEWTGKSQIFRTIKSFDDDIFDVPNMLRIPFSPQLRDVMMDPFKVNCIPEKIWTTTHTRSLNQRKMESTDLIPARIGNKRETFVYGAPDIATRTWLSAGEYTFFAATHRDGEYSIVENPTVDNDLMMETYGKINLSKFFLNHLSMTIDFLNYLKTADREYETQNENIEIVRKDFNGNFADQLTNGFKAGAKKLHVISDRSSLNEMELGR